jgi:3-phosphoshikimate 1-carboxyvinyltransferase
VTSHRLEIGPARAVKGTIRVPGDKSISHRYAMFGGIATGVTTVTHLAPGADVAATIACLRALGVAIDSPGPLSIVIHGSGREALRAPRGALDAANSGTTMRLLAGILAGCPFEVTMTGDASLSRRPMRRVIDPLTAMGARIRSNDGRAPLTLHGGVLAGLTWRTPVPSAQVKSAVLLAGLVASGTTTVVEPLATRDHTERAFPSFGLSMTTAPQILAAPDPSYPSPGVAAVEGGHAVTVGGGQRATAPSATLRVPGDPSSAAVWAAAAAALPGSSVELPGVCLNPHRLGYIAALRRQGADITIDITGETAGEPVGTVRVRHGAHVEASIGAEEIPSLIDELPVLAARAALGGRLEVAGASELRVKESDRITALVTGFRAMGVQADERPDGFVIDGTRQPTGGIADAAGDHRLVMAFTLVALGSSGPSVVTDAGAVAVSYPGFAQDLLTLTQ